MSCVLMDGKLLAGEVRERVAQKVRTLAEHGKTPCLAVVLVGENPASKVYVRNKKIACKKTGILSREVLLPQSATQQEVLQAVRDLNDDTSVDAILVQLPLPDGLDAQEILDEIRPEKDADGFHVLNAGLLFSGRPSVLPCTPQGCMELLHRYQVPIAGKHAVVIGRSNIVGRPVSALLMAENATVTVCHSRTQNLAEITRTAEILIAAIGRPGMITGDMVRPGAAVIDVGINRLPDGTLCGDCDFESVSQVAGYLTPVPGGVGPMTVAMLMENAVLAAEKAMK